MKLNLGKCKLIRKNASTDVHFHPNHSTIDPKTNKPPKVKKQAKYLGVLITEDTSTHNDIRARIAKAKAGFETLQRFWKNSNITKKWKLRVFQACFVPVLTYGMGSASIAPSDHRALVGFRAQCLRSILNIKSTYYTKVLDPHATIYTHMQVIQQAKMPTMGGYR